MSFWLGCAVWAYRDWTGDLFPGKATPRDFLRLYSRRLTAVEGNAAFYAVPAETTLVQWRQTAPQGFKFCPKLYRGVTHQGPLYPQRHLALEVIDRLRLLEDRLGPLMIQLPPSYGPNQLEDLTQFLAVLPPDVAVAVEVRHPGWFDAGAAQRLNRLLQQRQVGRCLLDTRPIYSGPDDPQRQSQRRKPQVPLQPVVTAPFSVVRYIGHPEPDRNQIYIEDWVTQIKAWLSQGTEIYLFVHCPQEVRSPSIVKVFQRQLEAAGAPVPALPWLQLQEPSQLSLFS
ncbi:MAG: DUF72 domain-containing protein [Elainellaceae cyanobacterium]